MKTRRLQVDTSRSWYVDLTDEARAFVEGEGDGLLNAFVPHATAGLAVIELGDGSEDDLRSMLDRLLPRGEAYRHRHGSPGHGADHLLPALLSPSLSIPVVNGRMLLGVWQHIVLVDTNRDNPQREVILSLVTGR